MWKGGRVSFPWAMMTWTAGLWPLAALGLAGCGKIDSKLQRLAKVGGIAETVPVRTGRVGACLRAAWGSPVH